MHQKGNTTLIILILLGLVGLFGFWYWNTKIRQQSLGEQIFKEVQNPIKNKLPEVDVFQAETNPFKDIYPNPFRETK